MHTLTKINKRNVLILILIVMNPFFSSCLNIELTREINNQKFVELGFVKLTPSFDQPVVITKVSTPVPTNTPLLTTEQLISSQPFDFPVVSDTPSPIITKDTIFTPTTTMDRQNFPGGKIVFICDIFQEDNRHQICIINADGSDYRRLTKKDKSNFLDPSFSPDGESILYSGNETGTYEIYELNLSSGAVNQLTSGPGNSFSPEISPDGEQIVYSVEQKQIWIMDRKGTNQHRLFELPQIEGRHPVWSPDGRKVLFTSGLYENTRLSFVDASGLNYFLLDKIDGVFSRSDWSPDGKQLVISKGKPGRHNIYLLDVRTFDLVQLTKEGNNVSPVFSPDGMWIAFQSYGEDPLDPNGCEIYIMRKDGSSLKRLTQNSYCDWKPHWGR